MEKRKRKRRNEVVEEVKNAVKNEGKELVEDLKQDLKEIVDQVKDDVKDKVRERVKERAEGLGDTLEKVFEKTKIAKVVKWLAGEDCGCDKRKEKLNKMFPYRKPNCLTEDEHGILENYFSRNTAEISPADQHELLKVYNRVLNVKQEPTSCVDCWRDIVMKLRNIYNEYKDADS
jgi:hypothetical protein